MNTIPSPRIDCYRRGDLASLPQYEPDPFPGWCAQIEDVAHDLRSIRIGDRLVCSFGYVVVAPDTGEGLAVVDRSACAGHGRQIAQIIRERQLQWMRDIMVPKALADCLRSDRTAMAFLRAIGYRRTQGPDAERAYFILELELTK